MDYKIKRLGLIRDQARFDNFKHMVAIKTLQEGLLPYESKPLYDAVKTIIQENGLSEKLDELERLAGVFISKPFSITKFIVGF